MATEKMDTTESKVPVPIPIYGRIVLSLDNCLLSRDKLERSPSVVDGLDPDTEYDLRICGCEFIQTAGILLKLPQVAMATGQVLFQRFYFSKSFVRHPMEYTAMGCIYLASKIEEAPRRIRDVINIFHHMRQVRCQKPITPLVLDQAYINLKCQVIKAERRILKELGFCVHVKHPHKLIVCYLQVLMLEKNRNALQMAWNFINDSLRTHVFLQYTPETVACACIYLTARKLKIVLPRNPPWFALFGVKEEDIVEVCRTIVKLYQRPKIDPDVLESKVEALKRTYEEEREKSRAAVNASANNSPNHTTDPKTPTPPLKVRKITSDLTPKKVTDPSPRKGRDRDRDRDHSGRNSNESLSPPRKIRNRDRDRSGRNSNDSHDSTPKKNRDRDRERERERERERDRELRERERERDRSKKERDYRSRRDRDYRSSSKKDRRRETWRSPTNTKIRI